MNQTETTKIIYKTGNLQNLQNQNPLVKNRGPKRWYNQHINGMAINIYKYKSQTLVLSWS